MGDVKIDTTGQWLYFTIDGDQYRIRDQGVDGVEVQQLGWVTRLGISSVSHTRSRMDNRSLTPDAIRNDLIHFREAIDACRDRADAEIARMKKGVNVV